MQFELMNFVKNLKYMGIGMLGVFMIIGIIIASTYAIGKLSEAKKQNTDKEMGGN